MTITRFAPSPNGYLHLGHARSALECARAAAKHGGRMLLRIEDIDLARTKAAFEDAIFEDLAWLGLSWDSPVMRQAPRVPVYAAALDRLKDLGAAYPCFCSRRELMARGPVMGSDGWLYDGFCKSLTGDERAGRLAAGHPHAWRLDVDAAIARVGTPGWIDERAGPQPLRADLQGDVVLWGKDNPASYHLAVVVDDAEQGIDLIVRGEDLFHNTHVHRLLQALLGYREPRYRHHGLIHDPETGAKLSKRAGSQALRDLRAAGWSAARVIEAAGLDPD